MKCGMIKISPTVLVDKIPKSSFVWYEDDWVHEAEPHSHKRAQLAYVEEGFQYLHIDKKIILLPQNHAAWIPSNLLHKTTTEATSIRLMTLFFDVEEQDAFYDNTCIFTVPVVLKEMLKYAAKWSKKQEYSIEEEAFLLAIFRELPNFVKHSLTLSIPVPEDSRLTVVCHYINKHFCEDINIIELAEAANLSLRTLERIFKKETGITVLKYIQLVKIIKSIEYLGTGEYTISEVAHKVGYKSLQAYSTSFYMLIKERPTAFLKFRI